MTTLEKQYSDINPHALFKLNYVKRVASAKGRTIIEFKMSCKNYRCHMHLVTIEPVFNEIESTLANGLEFSELLSLVKNTGMVANGLSDPYDIP